MSRLDDRTLLLLIVLGTILLLIINPDGIRYALDVIQSVVIIVLGIVATLYLWKRL
ncbi:MAG: hypothetical protein J0L63_11230 [Anaerolineae bacterium]|nr:hypothetical protein [Anaerolineae bacterium]